MQNGHTQPGFWYLLDSNLGKQSNTSPASEIALRVKLKQQVKLKQYAALVIWVIGLLASGVWDFHDLAQLPPLRQHIDRMEAKNIHVDAMFLYRTRLAIADRGCLAVTLPEIVDPLAKLQRLLTLTCRTQAQLAGTQA